MTSVCQNIESEMTRGKTLPNIGSTSIYQGRFKDYAPQILAAGKLTATGDVAANCLKPSTENRPESPEIIRRFRATTRPEAGQSTVFYGKAYDPHLNWAKEMTHGLETQPSILARDLVNPRVISRYCQNLLDRREQIYSSRQRAPLGKSHDQRKGMPDWLVPSMTTFGIQTEKDGSAGELVNPNKTRRTVESEYENGRDLYVKTHFGYRVGQQQDRAYSTPNFQRNDKFGIPTPHDNAGKQVRNTLKWFHDKQSQLAAPIVSKRVDDFRERTQPQLGKVHDPIKETMKTPPDHTFGILIKPDDYGVGDLLHNRDPGNYLRGKDRLRGIIAAMRQNLKKANYHNFSDMKEAFRHYDKDGSGKIDCNKLREVCRQFNLPIHRDLLEQVVIYCDDNGDGLIDYDEFANFLNWKDKLPSGEKEVLEINKDETSEELHGRFQKQVDQSISNHSTSSSVIKPTNVANLSTHNSKKFGVPTIRTDLPAPRIRRIDDFTNYGDESDAFGLVNPSIYTIRGVTEKDFLQPRTKNEIRAVFENIGVQMSGEIFDKVYNTAQSRHPLNEVSIESFRSVLDEIHS